MIVMNLQSPPSFAPLARRESKSTLGEKVQTDASKILIFSSPLLTGAEFKTHPHKLYLCETHPHTLYLCKLGRSHWNEEGVHGSSVALQKDPYEALARTAMKPGSRESLVHVAGGLILCVGAVASGIFDGVHVDVGYEHYAEPTVPGFPAALAMPANCLVNLAYVLLGWYWLPSGGKRGQAHYFQEVFALMALAYGPIQWGRLWTQHRWAAVLDQWVTLPIFAWAAVWCTFLERGWLPGTFLAMEATSLASYLLAILHPQGFELALVGHIAIVIWKAVKIQRRLGNSTTAWSMALGIVSCLGFVSLKLWDQELAQWMLFQRLTGHFWSKICDVLQFHGTFLFLTQLGRQQLKSQ